MLNRKFFISTVTATLLVSNIYAGSFVNKGVVNSFEYISMAVDDLDGDGDIDILYTGYYPNLANKYVKVYKNSGDGEFTEDSKALDISASVYKGSVAIADLDGDGDKDILITGKNRYSNIVSKIYLNDGSGAFSEDTANSLEGVETSSVAVDDLDGDGDSDILITGYTASDGPISKIYLNNGSGAFTEDTSNSLTAVYNSSVAIGDLDGDGHNDILITGENEDDGELSKIYLNDSSGAFTEDTSNSLLGVKHSSVAIADLDGDGHNDILITGDNDSSKIYINDGHGAFTDTSNSLDAVKFSSVAIADLDGDSDNDILLTGRKIDNSDISKIYLNDGSGNFTEDTSSSLLGVFRSSVAVADLNGDGDNDIILTGYGKSAIYLYNSESSPTLSKIYAKNTQITLVFDEKLDSSSTPDKSDFTLNGTTVSISSVEVIGNKVKLTLDSSITKSDTITLSYTAGSNKIQDNFSNSVDNFSNESVENNTVISTALFTEDTSNTLNTFNSSSSVAIADLDGDDDNDILLVGYDISYIAPIYINDGSGKFTKDTSNDLKGVSSSSIAIADLDSDSDKDILITGFDDASYDSYSKIYLNNASGTFTQDSNSLEKVYLSSVAVGDLDGDDYKDILLTGYIYDDDSPISKIYLNDGIGNFTPDDSNSLIDVQLSSVVIADLDGDDDSDILLTGQDSNSNKISKIYLNNGEGNFTEDSNSLEGVSHSSVAIADLDGDDDNDILLTGKKLNGDAVSKIYLNDGNGKFSEDITNSL